MRALDTARLACEALGGRARRPRAALGRASTPRRPAACSRTSRVLLVGHEPDFSQIVADLTGGRIDLKKGGVAASAWRAVAASCACSLRPAELERMAQAATSIEACPSCPRSRSPPAGSAPRCRARAWSRRSRPGINALKTFDPPLHALDGRGFAGARRRGKLLLARLRGRADAAGPPDVRRPPPALRHARRPARPHLADPGPLRGRARAAAAGVRHAPARRGAGSCARRRSPRTRCSPTLGPEAWPDPPPFEELLTGPRPLHGLLRDQHVIAGIGRSWVDEILWTARLSPFKRGRRPRRRRGGRAARRRPSSELGRALEHYEQVVQLPHPRQAADAAAASTATRASPARAAARRSRPSSTRTT